MMKLFSTKYRKLSGTSDVPAGKRKRRIAQLLVLLIILLAVVRHKGQDDESGSFTVSDDDSFSTAMEALGIPWSLPDWSYAGYRAGLEDPKAPENHFDVTKYGANKSGAKDASEAIQDAIDAAAEAGGGTVYLPRGKYLLKNQVNVSTSRVVIKGAGKGRTTLVLPMSLSEVFDFRPLYAASGDFLNVSIYCWHNAFIRIAGTHHGSSHRSIVAKITERSPRGAYSVTVHATEKMKVGDWVWLFQSDPMENTTGSLVAHVFTGNSDSDEYPASCGQLCFDWMERNKDIIRWASPIKAIRGNVVIFERTLTIDIRPEWKAELHIMPEPRTVRDVGVEDLTLFFEYSKVQPHHHEHGRNGIELRFVFNGWIRDVAIVNADNAVYVRDSQFVTVSNIETSVSKDRSTKKQENQGHIGIGVVNSADVRVSNFDIKAPMQHDTTVAQTTMVVWENGRGKDLSLDSHRRGAYGTLYTDVDIGLGSEPFTYGGGHNGRGFPFGAFTTYWNVRKSKKFFNKPFIYVKNSTKSGPCTYAGEKIAYVGHFVNMGPLCKGHYLKKTKAAQPQNLYTYQVQHQAKQRRAQEEKKKALRRAFRF